MGFRVRSSVTRATTAHHSKPSRSTTWRPMLLFPSTSSIHDAEWPMAEYRFSTIWRIEAPLASVWDAIYHADAWPQWWKSVQRTVELEPGDARGVGALHRYTWKGVLPYRLTFDMRVMRIEPLRLLEGRASGAV